MNKLDFPSLDVADSSGKTLTKAQKKNLRKKQKKKETKSSEYAFEIEEITTGLEEVKFSKEGSGTCVHPTTEEVTLPEVITEHAAKKKLRTLKKKLKQIEELEERLTMGEVKANKEQMLKISKKSEIIQEIQALSAVN